MKIKEISVVNKFFRKLFIDEVSRLTRDKRFPNPSEWEEENLMYNNIVKPGLFGSAEDGGKLIMMMRNYVEEMWDEGELWDKD